jgi:hypothetical protein
MGLVPPLNWKLRGGLPDRWLRIHTLPDSKRYAGTESEAAEIAERQVTTAKALFEDGAPVWLVPWRCHPSPGATEIAQPSEKVGVPRVVAGVLAGDAEDETIAVLVARLFPRAGDPQCRARDRSLLSRLAVPLTAPGRSRTQ